MVAIPPMVTARMPSSRSHGPGWTLRVLARLLELGQKEPRAGALRSRRRARASGPSAAAGDATSGGKTDGAGVAVVGIGTRGGVVVDRLLAQGVLPRAVFWSLNSDARLLSSARAPTAAPPRATSTPLPPARRTPSPPRAAPLRRRRRRRPSVIVVVASAAVGGRGATLRAVARAQAAHPPRKWFNVGGRGRGLQHKGPLIITAALAPFDFEGPRKATSALAALEAAAGCSGVACVARGRSPSTRTAKPSPSKRRPISPITPYSGACGRSSRCSARPRGWAPGVPGARATPRRGSVGSPPRRRRDSLRQAGGSRDRVRRGQRGPRRG